MRALGDGRLSVLHVSQPVGVGVPDVVAALVRDQVARGWNVFVASPPEERPLRAAVLAAGATHAEWRASRTPGRGLVSEIAELRRIVSRAAPELIHLHSSVAGLDGRLLLRGSLPTVFQPHGWSFHALRGRLRAVGVAWERLGARWADEIICVSEDERDVGKRAGISGRWRLIKNGVDLHVFAEAGPEARSSARERLGLAPDDPMVVCVSRLSQQKGQDMLVQSWPLVRREVPEARLFLIGDGPQLDELRRTAGAGVTFTGRRNDVPDWIAAADVVALPSRWEGMSLAMLEAMARGRSVVSTDVGGARETIGERAGAVVAREPRPFASALIERLLDPGRAAAEGAHGRRIVEAGHDLRKTADEVAATYLEILERRGRKA
jgi:glycosyltransferase involved in cell wall biosynthesis